MNFRFSPEGVRARLSKERDCSACGNSWKCDGSWCYGWKPEKREEDEEDCEDDNDDEKLKEH